LLCWSCKKIKGKRSCPAHAGDHICSRCCGTKRRVEIRCPEDCPYLHGEHDSHWEPPSRKAEETRFIAYFAEVRREQIPLAVFLHHLLLQAQQNFGTFSDEATLDIVATLARTFATLSKGVVYEHKTESPHHQAVIRWMGRILDKRQEIPEIPRASDTEITSMLQTIEAAIRSHREEAQTARSYLDTAERVFRAGLAHAPTIEVPDETEEGQSGLIV
jgi:hypothetical protein